MSEIDDDLSFDEDDFDQDSEAINEEQSVKKDKRSVAARRLLEIRREESELKNHLEDVFDPLERR